jgi:phosphoglycerol transferase
LSVPMQPRILDNERFRSASQYLAAALLSLLIVFLLLKLYRADFKVPLHYNGDALLHSMFIKGMIEHGWYWQNPRLGAPGDLKMYDFPAVDNSAAVVLKFLSLFSSHPIVVLNLFYLLTFPLIAISSLYVLRQFNISFGPALFGSLLYTFLPYHFMRDESHLFLSAYYFIPLVVMVLLWITSGALAAGRNRKFVLGLVICAAVGSTGVYYPFFTCYLLLISGVASVFIHRSAKALGVAAILIGVTFATVLINASPTLVYLYKHGDAHVTERSPAGPEIYGLKIAQLLLPITGHRVGFLNSIKKTYNENTVMTENDAAALGLVGSLGFLALLARLFYRRRPEEATDRSRMLDDLSVLNIFAVLLATIGGFSSIFGVLVFAGIRSYNRISVFIAFFSLMAVVFAFERLQVRFVKSTVVFYAIIAVVLVVALLDQSSRDYVPQYEQIHAEYDSDRQLIQDIEAALPARSMIYQLPYVPFPEHPRVNTMVDYDHFRGYLHSQQLRWSYGAMKKREDDLWQRQTAALPVDQLVETLGFAGFGGIYLDRHGYEDNGVALESQLSSALGTPPVISRNGRLVFFNTTDYNARLHQKYSETEWQAQQERALHPIMLDWLGGFSGFESSPDNTKTWRWCSNEGELHIHNPANRNRKIRVDLYFATGHEQFSDLTITGASLSDNLKINAHPQFYSKMIDIPAGETVIRFSSNAPRVNAPLDPRYLVFRVEDFKLTELEAN